MRHTLLVLLLLTGTAAAADDSMQVPWKKLCEAADGRQMVLTTTNGEAVEGRCMSVTVEEVAISQESRTIRIARSALSRIQVHRSRQGKQLGALHRDMRRGLRAGASALFSPLAPAGLVMLPGTLAWGAVAAPFCALADLGDDVAGLREVRIL